jgi:beta-fructofuranosidase
MSGPGSGRARDGGPSDARPVALHYVPTQGRFGDPKPIVHDGRVHVFFQNSPRPDGFDTMRWAHVVGDDLLRWTALPDALVPDADGPDAFGCWTGCVIRSGGRFHAFYTGVGGPDGGRQTVCRAESDDLATWRKDADNPLVVPRAPFATGERAAWRDPQVRPLPGGGWEMVLTAELDHGPRALRACVARLTSDDLRRWEVAGVLHHPADVHRCECPEVVPLGGRYALIYSDYGVQVRVADDAAGPYRRPAAAQLDDFRWYAAKTALHGERRLVFAFAFDRIAAAAPEVPAAPVLGGPPAGTPEGEPDDGSPWTWGGAMAFPRELALGPDGAPALRPVAELDALRAAPLDLEPDAAGAIGAWSVMEGADGAVARGGAEPGEAEELALLRLGRQPQESEIAFRGRWGEDGALGLLLHADAEMAGGYRLELDRRRGDLTLRRLIPHRNPASPILQRMPLPLDLPDEIEVRALLDRSLVELYVDRRVAFTGRLYERPADGWWGVTARGVVTLRGLRAWRLALPAGAAGAP